MNARTLSRWSMSRHAIHRMLEMGLNYADVAAVIEAPEVSYDQPAYGRDRAILQRGDHALAVDTRTRTVLTVLLREVEQWSREREEGG